MNSRTLTVASLLVLAVAPATADQPSQGVPYTEEPRLLDSGGYGFVPPRNPCLTEVHREQILTRIATNVELLADAGALPAGVRQPPLFEWPLAPSNGLSVFGYHGISNFVDQDLEEPDHVLDYNCGARTYDVDGYNHGGVDYFLWPFAQRWVAEDKVAVVAAAPGTIVLRDDGFFDMHCEFNSDPWNAVYVMHDDGSVAWYGHMKSGSLTPKSVGQRVETGEQLGIVASSGSSTWPHLHFEVHDADDRLVEPYQGPCNIMNDESWWEDQRPYYDSAINHLMTGTAPAIMPECPLTATPNDADVLPPGSTVYFTAFYRDQLDEQLSQHQLYKPDGSPWINWGHESNEAHYAASWWYWSWFINFSSQGTWRWEVDYEGRTYTHFFHVGSPSAAGGVPPDRSHGTPLRLDKGAGGEITLTWGSSCLSTDADYAIYEGTLGDYYSHSQLHCDTGGLTTKTLLPSVGSVYYLVVPRLTAFEGSYGRDSAGTPRPVGTSPCVSQSAVACFE